MPKHGLYKYVFEGQIIYIGKSNSDVDARIMAHANEDKFQEYLDQGTDIFVCELPNRVETDIMEKALINKHKPILNVQFNEPGDSEFIIVNEPGWVSYNETVKAKKKKIKNQEEVPTKGQIKTAEYRYKEYRKCGDRLFDNPYWEKWSLCVSEKIDYLYKEEDSFFMPPPFRRHEYKAGEVIPWDIISAWMIIEITELESMYEKYCLYANERHIQVEPELFRDNVKFLKGYFAPLEKCNGKLEDYIEYVCFSEDLKFEMELRQCEEAHEYYLEKAKEFVISRQPVYITVSFDEKDRYKKYGCRWDPHRKMWYLSERTWMYFKNPDMFLRRLIPEEADSAIKLGLLTEESLSKDARIAYKVYKKNNE